MTPMFAAAGYSLIYLLGGGGLFGALVTPPKIDPRAHRRLSVQPMSVHLVPLGDQGYNILDEFGSFHWQQDTPCSASRKTSYFDDRGQSDGPQAGIRISPFHQQIWA
jgi:hypothetical protein